MPGQCPRASVVQDHVALAEIELCGELMIAASAAEAAGEERLSLARIDEVLGTVPGDVEETAWQARSRPVHRCPASASPSASAPSRSARTVRSSQG